MRRAANPNLEIMEIAVARLAHWRRKWYFSAALFLPFHAHF
jgi:hypothetical protein